MEHELGPEIEIHGERPAWLADDEGVAIRWSSGSVWDHLGTPARCVSGWEGSVVAIRLRADHPYYLATSKGFTYWPGGEDAPEADEVLFRDGTTSDNTGWTWSHSEHHRDIIGYRKRVKQQDATPARPSDELVARMVAFIKECANNCDEEAASILAAINPDPMIQRARDICKDEFGVILPDDAPGMRAVLRGLREGGE